MEESRRKLDAESAVDTEESPSRQASTIESWVDEHADYLNCFASLRVRDAHVAEELVQETFVAALKAVASFRGDSSPRTWLVGLLRHKIADHFRKLSRERTVENIGTDDTIDSWFDKKGMWLKKPADVVFDPTDFAHREGFWAAFEGCLQGLPNRLAEAFVLRVLDEMDSENVCKVLSVTPTNLWVMLHRARGRLRSCLEANWFERESGEDT